MYREYFKRIMDLGIAILLLLVLIPVLIFIALPLAISTKGNPLFIQYRPGKDGKIFKIIKLRTMSPARDTKGYLLQDDKRHTPLGKFVRMTSIDEIPQLWNVIRGEMSLVGPRPLLPEFLPFYTKSQYKRHLVRPGITGWAQINGRNDITWNQKFILDIWYVENLSLRLDIIILFKTVLHVVFSKKNVSRDFRTIEPFNGTN